MITAIVFVCAAKWGFSAPWLLYLFTALCDCEILSIAKKAVS